MQLDTRQFKILQEMGFPMSGFALRKMKMAKPNEFYSAPDEQSAQNQIFSAHSGNEAVAPPPDFFSFNKANSFFFCFGFVLLSPFPFWISFFHVT